MRTSISDICLEYSTNNESIQGEALTARSPVQEQHIDFLLEEEFACNPHFLDFFVAEAAKGVTVDENRRKCRLPEPHLSSCEVIRSVTSADGESDVLVIYQSKETPSRKVAILIEDKIKAGFQKDQAKRYRTRGAAGRGKNWDEFWTCLIAPSKYGLGCVEFDTRISLEAIRDFFITRDQLRFTFKARVIEAALDAFTFSGLRVEDPTITEFRRFYAERAELFFSKSDNEIEWPLPRRAWWGDTWFRFRSGVLPKRTGIVHKCESGLVHLYFESIPVNILTKTLPHCVYSNAPSAVQTGKSASFEFRVLPIRDFTDPTKHEESLVQAFAAVENLVRFWRVNEHVILDSLAELWERAAHNVVSSEQALG